MKHLLIANGPTYGTERSYNGLRPANALARQEIGGEVTVFLMADVVACMKAGQRTANGFCNIGMMWRR